MAGQLNKILIFGSSGLLGTSFIRNFPYKNLIITSNRSSHSDLLIDISNIDEVLNSTKNIDFNFILNFTGYTDVDLCEKHKKNAKEVNIEGVKNLGKLSKIKNAKLIHISTDHVYNNPVYNTEDQTSLTNYYAKTKFKGELEALKYNVIVLRTNFFGKSYANKKSFSDLIISRALKNEEIKLFNDVYFNPLSIDTLCNSISSLILNNYHYSGIYNIGSKNGFSKGKFIIKMLEKLNIKCPTKNETITNFYKNRPQHMLMNTDKFEKDFKINLPSLEDQIDEEFSKKIYNQ